MTVTVGNATGGLFDLKSEDTCNRTDSYGAMKICSSPGDRPSQHAPEER
jgi:hypothetical protein